MGKFKFVAEFEFKASPKVLFQYISTPAGLQQWFAAKVTIKGDHIYDFIWDNESHPAKMTSQRLNKSTRFDFMNEEQKGNWVEFKLELSELTNTTFFRVTDNSDNTDVEDLNDLWDGLMDKLREIVGG
ncbi:MAG: START-like domain-containing protein [Spirosomaceae bacterium]|nr:START-like domain-containing protein [Spirosomataceae bacterium]